jgi:hypothetical protein
MRQGQAGDAMPRLNRRDTTANVVENVQANGALAGIGAHDVSVVVACGKKGIPNDFYMKTFNGKQNWPGGFKERHDSVCDFQVAGNAAIARRCVVGHHDRERPWRA